MKNVQDHTAIITFIQLVYLIQFINTTHEAQGTKPRIDQKENEIVRTT